MLIKYGNYVKTFSLTIATDTISIRHFKIHNVRKEQVVFKLPSSISDSSSRHLLKSAFRKCGFFLSLVNEAQYGPDSAFFIVNSIQRAVFLVVTSSGLILCRKFNVTSYCLPVSTELPLKYNVSSVNLLKRVKYVWNLLLYDTNFCIAKK